MEVWERVIEKFGLPLAGLVGVIWFFNRTLWPFIKERIAAAEKALSDQVTEARARPGGKTSGSFLRP